MRNLKSVAARCGVVVGALALAPIAFAAGETPTTAVGLAQGVDLSDAKSAALIIVGLLVSAGVVLWGARLVLSKFRPKV